MGVVFDLADRISVLVYGQIIASDTPERIRENAAVQRSLSRAGGGLDDARRCSKSTVSTPITARAISCTASPSASTRARSSACSAATASAARRRSRRSWATSAEGLDPLQGRGDRRPEAAPDGAQRPRLRPGDARHFPGADGPAESAARREARQGERPLDDGRHVPHVSAARGARGHAGRRAFRRRAADADDLPNADGRPGPRS